METLSIDSIDKDFVKAVEDESGQYLSHCYQCGNCTAGCPLAFAFDIPVHQIMRLLQLGQKDKVLSSHAIWLCATCETCTTRCPRDIDVAHVMDTLRVMARREGTISEAGIRRFYDIFLDSIKHYGRLYEVGTLLRYNLRSGKFFTDAELGPKLLTKGKLHFMPEKIRGAGAVRQIFERYARKRES
jgi:heterodisulfide reductase subunit C